MSADNKAPSRTHLTVTLTVMLLLSVGGIFSFELFLPQYCEPYRVRSEAVLISLLSTSFVFFISSIPLHVLQGVGKINDAQLKALGFFMHPLFFFWCGTYFVALVYGTYLLIKC